MRQWNTWMAGPHHGEVSIRRTPLPCSSGVSWEYNRTQNELESLLSFIAPISETLNPKPKALLQGGGPPKVSMLEKACTGTVILQGLSRRSGLGCRV